MRAQVFSIGLFLLSLAVLERVRLRQWPAARLAWLLPVAVVWGNAHGGFVMGALAVALYAAAYALLRRRAEAISHAALALGMIVAVTLLNPYGPGYLGFLLHAWSLDRTGIGEWEPMLAGRWSPGTWTLAAVAALSAGLAFRTLVRGWAERGILAAKELERWIRRTKRIPSRPTLVLLLVVGMSLLARRIHPFMALTLALYLPLLAPAASRLFPGARGARCRRRGSDRGLRRRGRAALEGAAGAADPGQLRPRRALAGRWPATGIRSARSATCARRPTAGAC